MSHRKGRETKQQPIMLPGPAVPGCSLVSFRFMWDMHSIHSVQIVIMDHSVQAIGSQCSHHLLSLTRWDITKYGLLRHGHATGKGKGLRG